MGSTESLMVPFWEEWDFLKSSNHHLQSSSYLFQQKKCPIIGSPPFFHQAMEKKNICSHHHPIPQWFSWITTVLRLHKTQQTVHRGWGLATGEAPEVSNSFLHRFVFFFCRGWYWKVTGKCLTPTLLLICSSFSRENGYPLLICSSLSTAQFFLSRVVLKNKHLGISGGLKWRSLAPKSLTRLAAKLLYCWMLQASRKPNHRKDV